MGSAGVCLTFGTLHLSVWARDRRAGAHLAFAVVAAAVVAVAWCELAMMRAQTPGEFGTAQRWIQLPIFVMVAGIAVFLRLYFGTGRLWLAGAAVSARFLALAINFAFAPNLIYRELVAVRRVEFLGQMVSVAEGVVSGWTWLGRASSLLLVVFVVDASIAYRRRAVPGARRRAWSVGGSLAFFALAATLHAALVQHAVIESPYVISLFFLGAVVAMGSEITNDVVRAAELARRLKESEEHAALATDAAQLGVWAWDPTADRVWATDRARQLLDLESAGEPTLAGLLGRVHPDDREPLRRAIEQAMAGSGGLQADCRVPGVGRTVRWITSRGRRDAEAAARLHVVSWDITARKLAEERLAESEARLRTVVGSAMDAIVTVDERHRIVLFNAAAETMFGCGAADAVGQPLERFLPGRVADMATPPSPVTGPAGPPLPPPVEIAGRRADGEVFPIEASIAALDLRGEGYLTAIMRDMTARRAAERESQRNRAEIAHLTRVALVSELSGSLAHELNQPLGAILSNAQAVRRLLDREPADLDEIRKILDDIVADDQHAGGIVHRVRQVLRKGETQPEPLDVTEVARAVLRLVRQELADRGIAAHAELRGPLPVVRGDRTQLQQVLLNLVVNAMDAMADTAPASRTLHVGVEEVDGGVRVRVSDAGPGIPRAMRDRLFEPFVTTKAQGMGMGLAICRTIVEAHGGQLWAEDNVDAGTTILFTLPGDGEPRG